MYRGRSVDAVRSDRVKGRVQLPPNAVLGSMPAIQLGDQQPRQTFQVIKRRIIDLSHRSRVARQPPPHVREQDVTLDVSDQEFPELGSEFHRALSSREHTRCPGLSPADPRRVQCSPVSA
jgi:hypothetical protein